MRIYAKALKGTHFEIEVKPEDSVADVKKTIETVLGADVYPAAKQMLIHQGKVLTDETTIQESKVVEDSFILIMMTKNKRASYGTSSAAAPTAQAKLAPLSSTQPLTTPQNSASGAIPVAPARTPAPTPARAPAQTPARSPIGTPKQTPIGTPKQTPVVTPTQTPKQTPIGTPKQTPVGTPKQTPVGTPKQTPSGTPARTPSGTPARTPAATPSRTPTQTPPRTPTRTPERTPAHTPVAAPVPAPVAVTETAIVTAQVPVHVPATLPASTPTRDSDPVGSQGDDYVQTTSNLSVESNLESTIQQIIDIGGGTWDHDTVVRALHAASNNPERAVEYLYSGLSNLATNPGGGVLDFLRYSQQFQTLRAMVQANPEVLQPMLQELGKQNPNLLRLIQGHQADFLRLINEPIEGGESGNLFGQLAAGVPQPIEVTQAERKAIERLEAMGFHRALVLEVFFACNKNEELAANYLLDHTHEFQG